MKLVLGRYSLLAELARGGMATVYLGKLVGPVGFSRTVAVKRLHPHLAKDPEFVAMLLDEARLAGRIQHPNVVAMLDLVESDGEVFIVMEYVSGETLSRVMNAAKRAGGRMPPAIASAVLVDTLRGLHAAHEVTDERGEALGLIHRDFTPQNIMIRRDGSSLVVDFGVAKAAGRFHTTEEGKIKGKLPYMAPEQVRAKAVSRQVDVYAAGAVLWEALVGERLVQGKSEAEVLEQLLFGAVEPPSRRVASLPAALDAVVMRALERDTSKRYGSAAEMAADLEKAAPPALPSAVSAWLVEMVGESLSRSAARVAELEAAAAVEHDSASRSGPVPFEISEPVAPASSASASSASASAFAAAAAPPAEISTSATRIARSDASLAAAPSVSGRRSRAAWLGATALVAIGIPIAWFARGAQVADTAPAIAAVPPAAVTAPPPASVAPGQPEPADSASAPASVVPAATVAASVAPVTPVTPGPRSPVPFARPPPAPTTPRPAADCAVPYVIDATGKRIYKRGCL